MRVGILLENARTQTQGHQERAAEEEEVLQEREVEAAAVELASSVGKKDISPENVPILLKTAEVEVVVETATEVAATTQT